MLSILILSFLATLNAWYSTHYALTLNKASNWSNACNIANMFSCSSVFQQDFAWFFWLPFTVIALVVYPIILILAIAWIKWYKKSSLIISILTFWWLIFNFWILYSKFSAWVYCALCLACSVIIVSILTISLIDIKKSN